jgi:glycosyltransferase involved in cell wall biosynthesis
MTQDSSTDQAPLVTLFVIAYKQEASVRAAIEGAFAQTYRPLEILLSDDASPDRTFEIMQEMANAYRGPHRVVLNRNPRNLGLIGHLDRIMEIASGGFVVQNAGDDVSDPRRVEALAHLWRTSGGRMLLVYSNARKIDAAGRKIGSWRPSAGMLREPTAATIVGRRGWALGATISWDRRLFDVFGPLEPGLEVEDAVLPLRAAILGEIGHVDKELVSHRVGGIAFEPADLTAHDVLHGVLYRKSKWRVQNDRYFLSRFSDWDYPGKSEAEAACRQRLIRHDHLVTLAESSRMQRVLSLPRSVAMSFRHRRLWPLAENCKYLFEEAYKIYWPIWGTRRRAALLSRYGAVLPPRSAADADATTSPS